MNYILEHTDQVRYFTDMRAVLGAANIDAQDYDWYVSDIETNWTPPGFSPSDQWLSGAALATFLGAYAVQFIWAVFSAVPRGYRPTSFRAPYVNGNRSYWRGDPPGPQMDGALFEIACWDSSGVILIDLPSSCTQAFLTQFPATRLLSATCA